LSLSHNILGEVSFGLDKRSTDEGVHRQNGKRMFMHGTVGQLQLDE
jgi:hypothetical protein